MFENGRMPSAVDLHGHKFDFNSLFVVWPLDSLGTGQFYLQGFTWSVRTQLLGDFIILVMKLGTGHILPWCTLDIVSLVSGKKYKLITIFVQDMKQKIVFNTSE